MHRNPDTMKRTADKFMTKTIWSNRRQEVTRTELWEGLGRNRPEHNSESESTRKERVSKNETSVITSCIHYLSMMERPGGPLALFQWQ